MWEVEAPASLPDVGSWYLVDETWNMQGGESQRTQVSSPDKPPLNDSLRPVALPLTASVVSFLKCKQKE